MTMTKRHEVTQTTCFALLLCITAATLSNGNVLNDFDDAKYHQCSDVQAAGYKDSGMYRLHSGGTPVLIQCNFNKDQAVGEILRRFDGALDFQKKNYKDYQQGFEGSSGPQKEFWLGLDKIHTMTKDGNTGLKVILQDWNRQIRQVTYDHFGVASQDEQYRLTIGGFHDNPEKVGDMLGKLNGSVFYAVDNPDTWNCAEDTKSGWWFSDVLCSGTLPTGHYYKGGKYTPSGDRYDGMYWTGFHGMDYSLSSLYIEVVQSN